MTNLETEAGQTAEDRRDEVEATCFRPPVLPARHTVHLCPCAGVRSSEERLQSACRASAARWGPGKHPLRHSLPPLRHLEPFCDKPGNKVVFVRRDLLYKFNFCAMYDKVGNWGRGGYGDDAEEKVPSASGTNAFL